MGNSLKALFLSTLEGRGKALQAVLESAGESILFDQTDHWRPGHTPIESYDLLIFDQETVDPGSLNLEKPALLLSGPDMDPSVLVPENLMRFIRYAIEKHQNTMRLKGSQLRFELAMRGSNDGLWDWNLETNTVYWSERWASIMGLEWKKLDGQPDEWWLTIIEDDRARVRDAVQAHLNDDAGHLEIEYRIIHPSLGERWVLTRGMAVRDSNGTPTRIAGSLTDIHQRKTAEEQIAYQALHDQLTGLPNRTLLLDRLAQCFNRLRRHPELFFATLFLDLDRFKVINDSLGHWAGDQLLIEVAQRLAKSVREGDTVARLSGDEFTLLLDDLQSHNDALAVADRIQQALALPFQIGSQEVYTNASIGIAFSNRAYEKPDEILRDADAAMYRAKSSGRGKYVIYGPGMHTKTMATLQMESQLRKAVQEKELKLVYQPILKLPERTLTGVEVFVRWPQPKADWVPPSEFLPLAEETGLILPLGQWVMEEACSTMQAWDQEGRIAPDLQLNINLSARQFRQPNLVSVWQRALIQWPRLKGRLRLEITEHALMCRSEDQNEVVDALKKMGIKCQIDDFGTGFSSLANLAHLTVDGLKIDRSFIMQVSEHQKNTKIIRAIVTLAKNLGISVTAEGIETQEQLEVVTELGCEEAQGYLFSPPLTKEAFEEHYLTS